MFLITTADQRFWPSGGPVLFLGEWCKLYDQKHIYERLESETLAYHWDDRARLYADYRYLGGVYEKYLDTLVSKLNDLHRVNHSQRFWREVARLCPDFAEAECWLKEHRDETNPSG